MLNFARNQLIIPEKWGFEPCGEYESPTFKTGNRIKTQKDRGLQIRFINREQNCSRHRLFTNCTPPYLTIFTILPDRGITKIAETVLVSAICGILPICSVIRLGLEPRTPTLKVLCSTSWASESRLWKPHGLFPKSDAKLWSFFQIAKYWESFFILKSQQ